MDSMFLYMLTGKRKRHVALSLTSVPRVPLSITTITITIG